MNNNENSAFSPNTGQEKELLNELMPKLGIEAAEDGGRYKRKLRTRYILTRVAVVCVVIAAVIGLALYLLRPVELDVTTREEPDKLTVEMRTNRAMMLESVTASLDGRALDVEQVDIGSYRLVVEKNGQLSITARTVTDQVTETNMTVDNIDDDSPHLAGDELADGVMTIYLSDDGTGVDWDTLTVTDAGTGQDVGGLTVDEAAGCIRFPFPDQDVRISVQDKNGNPLSALLEPSDTAASAGQAGPAGAEPEPSPAA